MPAVRVAGLECPRCAALFDGPPIFTGCPRCRAQHVAVDLGVTLDLSPLAGFAPRALPASPKSLWRYRAFLPKLYAKDETQNPTWSYKDRLNAIAVTHVAAAGARRRR